jgi:hypothetical protein
MDMFGIGGFNPISLLATTAFGPAGGLFAQLASQVISQFGQGLIQQMGQQMNLPQSTIDLAQGQFAASYGDFNGATSNLSDAIAGAGRELGASPSEIGEQQRTFQDAMLKMAGDAMETEEAKDAKAGAKGGSGGGGWLRAIARAMGEAADKTATKLEQDAAKLDNATPSQSAEYQADAQAFSMLMGSINTALKAIGEALSTMARKQ